MYVQIKVKFAINRIYPQIQDIARTYLGRELTEQELEQFIADDIVSVYSEQFDGGDKQRALADALVSFVDVHGWMLAPMGDTPHPTLDKTTV